MKNLTFLKLFSTALMLTITLSVFAQGGQKWATVLNSISPGDAIGTSNAQSLVFKVNSMQQMAILTNGNVQLNSISGAGTGICTYDANGTIIPLSFPGSATMVLVGNGTFVNGSSFSQWITSGNNIYYNGGNVGIGTSTPNYPLTVQGTALINGNLFAQNLNASAGLSVGAFRIVNGVIDSIVSSAGTMQLNANTVSATSAFSAQTVSATQTVAAGTGGPSSIKIDGNSGSITSPSGNVSFGNNNITTTGNISAGNLNLNKLTVQDTIRSPLVITSHIEPMPGDSVIQLGDSHWNFTVAGFTRGNGWFTDGSDYLGALGFNNTFLGGANNDYAVGNLNFFTNTQNSIALGFGLHNNNLNGIILGYAQPSIFVNGANNMVGIGTTTPHASLNIEASKVQGATAFAVTYLYAPPNCQNCNNNDPEAFTIDTIGNTYVAGNMGIGTPSPTATLEVASVNAKAFSVGTPIGQCNNCNPISYIFGDIFTIDNKGNTYTAGNVGIGTKNPQVSLEVHGSISLYNSDHNTSLFFGQDQIQPQPSQFGEWGIQYEPANNLGPNSLSGLNFWKPYVSGNFGNAFLFLADNGNVGIGTAKPISQFQINSLGNDAQTGNKSIAIGMMGNFSPDYSSTYIGLNGARSTSGSWTTGTDGTNNGAVVLIENAIGNLSFVNIKTTGGAINNISDDNTLLSNVKMTLTADGNLGIGTITPAYNLDVAGIIRAQEIKVCPAGGGCDFVFDNNYKLMPIKELEQYLKLNHHLPDIASAKEMINADGVDLGKMNFQLLQKVEELTLYTIQLQRQVDEMNQLKTEVNQLKIDLANMKQNIR